MGCAATPRSAPSVNRWISHWWRFPPPRVAAALEECATAGVKNALIISSGFAEEGGAAGDMQAALVEVTQRTGIRACGPNCEGYFNALGKIATTFSPTVEVKEDAGRVLVSENAASA